MRGLMTYFLEGVSIYRGRGSGRGAWPSPLSRHPSGGYTRILSLKRCFGDTVLVVVHVLVRGGPRWTLMCCVLVDGTWRVFKCWGRRPLDASAENPCCA